DLGEVRGLGYYTGIRFAGFVPGVGDAVLLGGRYDDLVARYGRSARATGFAIDVEAIAQGEQALGVVPGEARRRPVLVAGRGDRPFLIAGAVRKRDVRPAVDAGGRGADELVAYAAEINARAVLVVDGAGGKLLLGGAWRPIAAAVLVDAAAGRVDALMTE